MSWSQSLQDAAFRGVRFEVLAVDDSGGKSVAATQLPYVAGADLEDMGNDPLTFEVTALLRGDDYETALNALIAALDQTGPGELMHPIYGLRQVIAGRWRVHHEAEAVDSALVSISFMEHTPRGGVFTSPAAQLSADRVADLGEQARDTATDAVASIVETIAGGPLPRVTEINAAFTSAKTKLSGLLNMTGVRVLLADLDPLLYPRSALGDLRSIVDGAVSGLSLGGLNGLFKGDVSTISMGAAVSDFNRLAQEQSATVVISPISSELQDIQVSAALTAMARTLNATAVASSACTILAAELDLLALQRAEIERLAAVARTALQLAMQSARTALDGQRGPEVAMLLSQAAHEVQEAARSALELRPPVISIQAPVGGHSRLLAHALYGDHTRAAELQRLNDWGRQVFIEAGEEVQAYAR